MRARERLRFMDHVSPTNQELLRSLPPNLLKQAERGLHKVRRGQGNRRLEPFNGNFYETDLEHTIDMLGIAVEISREYPHVTETINPDQAQIMIMIHDLGEIDPRIGDVPFCGPEREDKKGARKKSLEPYVARRILRRIPNPHIRDLIMASYQRYETRNPKDPIAQFVKLDDNIQGTTRAGLEGIFGRYGDYGFDKPPQPLQEHVEQSLPKMMLPALNLARLLGRNGRVELQELMRGEFQRLDRAGYEEASYYATQLYGPLILHPY